MRSIASKLSMTWSQFVSISLSPGFATLVCAFSAGAEVAFASAAAVEAAGGASVLQGAQFGQGGGTEIVSKDYACDDSSR